MEQPPGFILSTHSSRIRKLNKALYGLKQVPRARFDKFNSFLLTYGFIYNTANSSLFIYHSSHGCLMLLLYVDDILLNGSSFDYLHEFISTLRSQFSMKDLGPSTIF